MVDADSNLKLLPTSILDTYKVIEHIDMLSMGIQYQPYTVIPTLLGSDFGALGHLWSQNDMIMSWLRLTATSNCFPHPYCTCTKYLSTLICCPLAYGSSLTQFYPPYLAQILGFWVTCGVKIMWLCHGWGWWPPQTAYHIHIRHVQSVVHIDILSTCIHHQSYTVIPTLLLGSDFGVLGHLLSQNDVIMSWLRLTATSNCFPHPYWTYTKWLSTLIYYPWAYSIHLTQLYPHYLGQILGFWVTCGVKIMWWCHGWGW